MSTKLSCEVCGGSNYYTESGFYFCNECHAQSQEVVEEVVNPEDAYAYGRSRLVRNTVSPSSQASVLTDHEWTTWEAHNFILKGMVDELISFGAAPELKVVVLQLWVRLLKELSVAFVSSRIDRMPKLGLHYHDRDLYVVYGISDKSKIKKTKKTKKTQGEQTEDDGTASQVTSSKQRITKTALAQADYDSTFIDNSGDELSLLDYNSSESSFSTSSKKKSLGKRLDVFSAKAKQMRKTLRKKKKLKQNKDNKKRQHDPAYITRSRLLAIIYLGLRLIDSDIFLGDIMRWISEGMLSYYEVSHFFPDCSNLKAVDGMLFGSFPRVVVHNNLREKTAELAKLLRIDTLTVPDLSSLAARYVEELQLPCDVLACVRKLLGICNPAMKFDLQAAEIPNYEARAMAFIIVVLKLLFGLDGKTEHKNSETAAEFNRYCSSETPKLFVFDDWRNYVECRKAFISLFHFPTKDAVFKDGHEGVESYIEKLKTLRQKDENGSKGIFVKDQRMNPSVTSVLERTFEKLADLEPNSFSGIKFAPSLKPCTSYFETINEVYRTGTNHETPIPELLKQDFKATQLEFLLDPKKFIESARAKGMKIKLCKTSAQKKVKKITVEGRKELRNKVLRVFLEMESKSDSGNPQRDVTLDTGSVVSSSTWEVGSEVSEQVSASDSECPNKGLCGSSKFVSPKQNKRKRKHSETQETSILDTSTYSLDVNKQRYKKRCFKGKCKIESTTVNECSSNNRTNTVAGKSEKCFRIYSPSSRYWFLTIPPKRFFGPETFNLEVMPKFSTSFQWLLSECASLLHVPEWDLYTEVVLTETIFGYVLNPDSKQGSKSDHVSHFLKCVNTIW